MRCAGAKPVRAVIALCGGGLCAKREVKRGQPCMQGGQGGRQTKGALSMGNGQRAPPGQCGNFGSRKPVLMHQRRGLGSGLGCRKRLAPVFAGEEGRKEMGQRFRLGRVQCQRGAEGVGAVLAQPGKELAELKMLAGVLRVKRDRLVHVSMQAEVLGRIIGRGQCRLDPGLETIRFGLPRKPAQEAEESGRDNQQPYRQ